MTISLRSSGTFTTGGTDHLNKSRHDQERDYIAANWRSISPLTCAACQTDGELPRCCKVRTEAIYDGGLRADVAFFDASENLLGVIEVIDTNPPSKRALAVQEKLQFAHYRLLSPRTSAKRRKFRDELARGEFTYSEQEGESKWLCSRECLTFFRSA